MASDALSEIKSKSYTIAWIDTFDISRLASLLAKRYGLRVLPWNRFLEADFLFCDTFDYKYEKYDGVRILITAENHPADLNVFDYCLTHEKKEDDRRLYFPYFRYRLYEDGGKSIASLLERPALGAEELAAQNRRFCAFVCRNGACKRRNRFVRHLIERNLVDSGGPFMNNIGHCVEDKVEFQRGYLFSVAYENESAPGYLTEKIMDAFLARSIPIYWGDPCVAEIFNPEAFVNAADFRSETELVEYLVRLSQDPERLLHMLNAPVFRNPRIAEEALQGVYAFFDRIFERGPGATRRTRWQRIKAVLQNYYGHGFFRTLRRISRRIRGKKVGRESALPNGAMPSKWEKK